MARYRRQENSNRKTATGKWRRKTGSGDRNRRQEMRDRIWPGLVKEDRRWETVGDRRHENEEVRQDTRDNWRQET